MADLADILAGAGPLGPSELQAQIYGGQAADPRVLATSSGPVGQAIGQLSGGFAQAKALAAAQQIAQQQTGAMGDIGKYLSAEDPVRAAAADTGGDAVARWAMLRSTPEQVAQMRELQSRAALQRAQTILPTARGGLLTSGGGGVPTLPGAGGPGAPLVPGIPTTTAPGQLAPGVSGAPTASSADTGGDPAVLPPGKARMDWLQHQPLAVQQAWLARLKQSQTGGR
jgi:hypothetical protein